MLEERLNAWVEKVLKAHAEKGMGIDTYQMIVDIDKIIAEEFDHDYVFDENR